MPQSRQLASFIRQQRAQGKVQIANHCLMPSNLNTTANAHWVNNNRIDHISGPFGYTKIQLVFCNWWGILNGETAANYDFTLRAGLMLNGVYYPAFFGGVRDVFMSKNFGYAVSDEINIYIPPNATFYTTNLTTASDAGAAGSYKHTSTVSTSPYRRAGAIQENAVGNDYTLGVNLSDGGTLVPAYNGNGGLNCSLLSTDQGVNISGSANLAFYYGMAGQGALNADYPGSGATGYIGQASGHFAAPTLTNHGTGYVAGKLPLAFIQGGNATGSGYGASTSAYGPSLIIGTPARRGPSLLVIGDSWNSQGAPANYLRSDFGLIELFYSPQCGVHKMSWLGESAAGWLQNYTHMWNALSDLKTRGLGFTHLVNAMGVNDMQALPINYSKGSIQSRMNQINGMFRQLFGGKIISVTLPPSTTSTDSWLTVANQTAKTQNYALNDMVMQYNADLRAGVGQKTEYVIDQNIWCVSPTDGWTWRCDLQSIIGNTNTTDGVHMGSQLSTWVYQQMVANGSYPTLGAV
jgi:hypothetical protein